MEIDLADAAAAQKLFAAPLGSAVCIVGGGIAGLLLADALTRAGQEVLLLEAGGAAPESALQALAGEVDLVGQAHIGTRAGRTWALGGNSLTWGGQLLPLPEVTFWPVDSEDLSRYTRELEQLLGVDALPYEAVDFWRTRDEAPPELPAAQWGLQPLLSKFAPFGKRNLALSIGRRLRAHPRARVVLHARVVRLLWSGAGDCVTSVEVQLRSGERLPVETPICVLAAGTVETCRLLLASPPPRVGREPRWFGEVGRNFQDHLTLQVAVATGRARSTVLRSARPWLTGGLRGTAHVLKLEATPGLRRQLRLNPVHAHWTFAEPEDAGLGGLRQLLRARQQGQSPRSAAAFLPRTTADLWRLYRDAKSHQRRFVSDKASVALRLNVAQRTPSAATVVLAAGADAMGQPVARVDWQFSPEDPRTLGVYAAHLRDALATVGLNESEGLAWRPEVLNLTQTGARLPDDLEDARHPMGGACMGADPESGVVDASLRVHGVSNLYVLSAAVFPDGSALLPTLTLMALALRLAHHLSQEQGQ